MKIGKISYCPHHHGFMVTIGKMENVDHGDNFFWLFLWWQFNHGDNLCFMVTICSPNLKKNLVSFKGQNSTFKVSKMQKFLAGARFLYKNEHFRSFRGQNATFKCLKFLVGARFSFLNEHLACFKRPKCHFQMSKILLKIAGARFW